MPGSEHIVQRPVFGNQGVSPPATGVSVVTGFPAAFEVDRYSYSPPLAISAGGAYTYGTHGESGLGATGPADLARAGAVSYSGADVTIGPGYLWWATVVIAISFPGPTPLTVLWNVSALKTSMVVGWALAGGGNPVAYANGYSGAGGQTLPLATLSNLNGDAFNVTSVTLAIEALRQITPGVAAF